MPIQLTVNGTTFNYPKQGEDPNWGNEASLWAKEVTNVLATVVGSGDILEDNFPINNNINVYTDISKLNFNPNIVRSAKISYVIHRTHDLNAQIFDATGCTYSDFVTGQVGAYSSATVTIVDYTLLAGAVLTLNGQPFTEGVDWTAAVDNDTTAASLASAINSFPFVLDANAVANVVTVSADTMGVAGDGNTLVSSDPVNLLLSSPVTTGGIDDIVGPAKYFTVTSANNATSYYVWFQETPNDQDPAIGGKTGVLVTINPLMSVSNILDVAANQLNALIPTPPYADFNSYTGGTQVLTIICGVGGPVSVVQSTTVPNATLDIDDNTYGLTESGEIQLTQQVPINNITQWELTQTAYGSSGVSLDITTAGQIRYQSSNLTGLNYSGKITFTAQALGV